MKRSGCAILGLVVLGCGSFEDDMKMICNVETLAKAKVGDMNGFDPSQRVNAYAVYIKEHAKTKEGKAIPESLTQVSHDPPATQQVLEDAMKRAGLSECAAIDAFRTAAEASLFDQELESICAPPQAELAAKLQSASDPEQRVKIRQGFYDANLKSERAKALWVKLRDDTKTVEERAKAAAEAADKAMLVSGVSPCSYLEDVRKANAVKANAAHEKALALANAEGDTRDLEGAQKLFDLACELGEDVACRQAVLNRALLSPAKK